MVQNRTETAIEVHLQSGCVVSLSSLQKSRGSANHRRSVHPVSPYRVVFFIGQAYWNTWGNKVPVYVSSVDQTQAVLAALQESQFTNEYWRIEVYEES